MLLVRKMREIQTFSPLSSCWFVQLQNLISHHAGRTRTAEGISGPKKYEQVWVNLICSTHRKIRNTRTTFLFERLKATINMCSRELGCGDGDWIKLDQGSIKFWVQY